MPSKIIPGPIDPKPNPTPQPTPTPKLDPPPQPLVEIGPLLGRLFSSVLATFWPTPLGSEPTSDPDFKPFVGNGNRGDNSNPHIVYEFTFIPSDGRTPVLKYGISDEFRNGLDRPELQLPIFRKFYGKTVEYKILTRTLNRKEALEVERLLVDQHFAIWSHMPREQQFPRPR